MTHACTPCAGADPERVIREIEEVTGLDCTNILRVSAKMGIGIIEVLEAIVQRVPPPKNTVKMPLRALIFDSYYVRKLHQVPGLLLLHHVSGDGGSSGLVVVVHVDCSYLRHTASEGGTGTTAVCTSFEFVCILLTDGMAWRTASDHFLNPKIGGESMC
jgi:hypothetical protein